MQTAWALVVPPFRGIDEHDHAYKAAAVARGDWSADHEESPTRTRVPGRAARLVDAATPVCESWPYTKPDNCRPQGPARDGLVWVSSSAARYNPVAYFFIGTGSLLFEGTAALYAMRAVSALLSAHSDRARGGRRTPLGADAVAGGRLRADSHPHDAVLHHGGGAQRRRGRRRAARLVGPVGPGGHPRGPTMVPGVGDRRSAAAWSSVRSLGPLWCLLIVVTIGLLLGLGGVRSLLRRPVTWACAGVVAVATAGGVAWTLAAGTNAPGPPDPMADSYPTVWRFLPNEMVLWVLQTIGAFPSRDDAGASRGVRPGPGSRG